MDRRRSTCRSRNLLLLFIQCSVFVHLWSSGVANITSLTQRADQATHGRLLRHQSSPTIQETSDKEDTSYGLRIQPAETKRGKTTSPTTAIPPRSNSFRGLIVTIKNSDTAEKRQKGNDVTMVMADAGGKAPGAESGDKEEKKTLAQQVADGKYGLIQELLPKRIERPGIISYAANPEVPSDNSENLGGLGQEDIWLAEDHVLVLAGGGFRDKGGGSVQPWPPIDDYKAPRRQVKIPSKPSVPPPFPVQLREGEPVKLIGLPFPQYPLQGNYPTGSGSDPWAGNGSLPATAPHHLPTILEPGSRYPEEPIHHNNTPGHPPPYLPPFDIPPPNNYTSSSQENVTFDEDDPSLYYPPPYDFYYPHDNTTEIPPGPLVPGIVLPPPPDFFSPLNETSGEAIKVVLSQPPEPPIKPKAGANIGYRKGIHPENRFTTSTPGPKYLPVIPRPSQETTYTTQKESLASQPMFPTKASVQIQSNHAIYGPEFSTITDNSKPSVISPERGGKERLPEHSKRQRYPAKTTENQPLYYYDGLGISEIVETPSPKLIHDYHKEVSPPQKANKDHIIYIFTSPDFNTNQVSSTEYPQTLRDSYIYQHSFEDNRQAKSQNNNQRYVTDVPTPPRIENFHNDYTTSTKKDQFGPPDKVPHSGYRFPVEVSISDEINVTSNPSNYFYQENNTQDQHYKKITQRKPQQAQNPIVYYPITSTVDQHNSTEEGYWRISTPKPLVPFSFAINAYSLKSPHNNFDSNPTYYRQQDYLTYNKGQEAASIITTNPHQNAEIYRGTFSKQTPLQGVNVITVKPPVLYAGSGSAKKNYNIHSEVSGVTSNTQIDHSSYTDNRNSQRNVAQKQFNPSITIVTSKPYIYNVENPLNNGETKFSVQEEFYSVDSQKSNNRINQSSGKNVSPQRVKNGSQPSSVTQSPVYSNLGDPRVHHNSFQVRVPSVGGSTQTPRQQNMHQELVTPTPHYHTIPRSPKYITTPSGRQNVHKSQKKPPMAQYQEYFEAAINSHQPSHLSPSANYQREYESDIFIHTTKSPAYHIQENSGGQQSKLNVYSPHVTTVYTQKTQSSLTQPTGIVSNVENPHTHYKLDTSGVTRSTAIQSDRYIPKTPLAQDNSYRQIYSHTTPSPVYYQYPENKNPLTLGSDFLSSSSFSSSSSTVSPPLPAYYTTHDVNLFDEATKNYFNVFGQKIPEHGQSGQQYQQTTPLPPPASESNDRNGPVGRYIYTYTGPTKESPEQKSVISLQEDIRVNFQNPLPPINPDSESILQRTLQPSPVPPVQEGGALVSYQLPGVDGKGATGGSHYFFLTPQPVSPDRRPHNFGGNSHRKQLQVVHQGQRPVVNNYWAGYTSR